MQWRPTPTLNGIPSSCLSGSNAPSPLVCSSTSFRSSVSTVQTVSAESTFSSQRIAVHNTTKASIIVLLPVVSHHIARALSCSRTFLGPLCNTPVAIPPGEDPNIRMERHINAECSVMTGKSGRIRSQPVCARGKCGKVLYAPIACNVRSVLLSIRAHPDAEHRPAGSSTVLSIASQRTTAARVLRRPQLPLPSHRTRLHRQASGFPQRLSLRRHRMHPVLMPLCPQLPELRPLRKLLP